jgi:hypothetical protein
VTELAVSVGHEVIKIPASRVRRRQEKAMIHQCTTTSRHIVIVKDVHSMIYSLDKVSKQSMKLERGCRVLKP